MLAESANIIEYISEHFGRSLIPERWKTDNEVEQPDGEPREETDEWLRFRFYMNYAEGSLMTLIGTGALANGEFFFIETG